MAQGKLSRPEGSVASDLCCPSLIDTPLDEDEAEELGRVLRALGDPIRLRLISLVASQARGVFLRPRAPARKNPTNNLAPHQGVGGGRAAHR